MKVLSSTKIAVGFALAVAAVFGGQRLYSDWAIGSAKFDPLVPGKVNIVGIDAGTGFRIVVANQVAQLVEGGGGSYEASSGGEGPTEGANKKRVPIKDMLKALQGDKAALGNFIMIMNDIREDDRWPTERIVWTAEDLRKVFAGDKTLEARLVRDLNMNLDGTPLTGIRTRSLENGIMVDFPVQVTVNLDGVQKTMEGRVQEPYRPRMVRAAEDRYKEKANLDEMMMAGYYGEEAKKVLADPALRENIRKTLENRISPENAKALAEAPDRILRLARVVVTEAQISDAYYRSTPTPNGKMVHDLTIVMNDEGRRRLWQYSKKRVGTQLLMVADGIAIAAPRIQHELAQGEITITQMWDKGLVRDAVNMIKVHNKKAEVQ